MVKGTFLVFNTWAGVLIDSRASHLFIAFAFITALGLEPCLLQPALVIQTLVRGRVRLDRVCLDCDLIILDLILHFDFIVLGM